MNYNASSAAKAIDTGREEMHRRMLSAVSHDLKTPLATMIGSLEVYRRMDEKLTPEKRAALVRSALTEAYRLDNFITNILDMAKLEGGMVAVKSEACNLTSLLQDSLTRLGPRREKGKIELRLNGSEVSVYTDPMLLGRAAGLLLENALKHAGQQPVILVEYEVLGDHATIRVKDDGPGIPKGTEEAIFSKYTRLNKADQQNAGTGLGLAICKAIMDNLSGRVEVASGAAGGAAFTLTFPTK